MKKFIFSLLFVPLFLACWFAESFAADWLFTYPGGKLKAVTFSYDDGVIERQSGQSRKKTCRLHPAAGNERALQKP